MTDVELIAWGKEAARRAETNLLSQSDQDRLERIEGLSIRPDHSAHPELVAEEGGGEQSERRSLNGQLPRARFSVAGDCNTFISVPV
jgi:hypothetical protein